VNCVKFSFFDRFCSQNDVNNVCKVLQVPQTPYRGFAPGPTRDSVPPDSLGYSSPNDNSWRRHYLHFQRPKILSHDLPIFHQRSHPLLTFVEVCSVQSWTTSRDRRKMRSSARQSLWHEWRLDDVACTTACDCDSSINFSSVIPTRSDAGRPYNWRASDEWTSQRLGSRADSCPSAPARTRWETTGRRKGAAKTSQALIKTRIRAARCKTNRFAFLQIWIPRTHAKKSTDDVPVFQCSSK